MNSRAESDWRRIIRSLVANWDPLFTAPFNSVDVPVGSELLKRSGGCLVQARFICSPDRVE